MTPAPELTAPASWRIVQQGTVRGQLLTSALRDIRLVDARALPWTPGADPLKVVANARSIDIQLIADATYQSAAARRALETDSGKRPQDGAPSLSADLSPEGPLVEWEARVADGHPNVRAAADEARAAERLANATRASLLPTLSVAAQNRFTNATGFQDRASIYSLSASVAIRFDASQIVAGNGLSDAAAVARVREDRARRAARDRVFLAWQSVRAQIDKAQAARAGVEANRLAADIAKQRYEAGTATFLDVLTAERDAFSAEVTRIQADGDLLFSRADLRIAAGHYDGTERGKP